HLLDGGYALSATTIRLSLRGREGLDTIRDVQGDGTSPDAGDHQPRDGRDLAGRSLSGLGRSLVFVRLVPRQVPARLDHVGCPRLFLTLAQGFRGRPQHAKPEIL